MGEKNPENLERPNPAELPGSKDSSKVIRALGEAAIKGSQR